MLRITMPNGIIKGSPTSCFSIGSHKRVLRSLCDVARGWVGCVDCRRVVLRLRQGHRTRPFGLATALRSASRLVRGHPSLRHRTRLGQAEGISRGLPGCRCETSGVRGIDSASRPQHPCGLACPPCTCERHHRRYATTDSQGARSRPQRPMPLWLWQEVQALPWSTEIVALTCGTQNCLRPPSSLLKRPRQACCATPVQDQKCWNTAAFEQSQFIDHTGWKSVLCQLGTAPW